MVAQGAVVAVLDGAGGTGSGGGGAGGAGSGGGGAVGAESAGSGGAGSGGAEDDMGDTGRMVWWRRCWQRPVGGFVVGSGSV